MAASAALSSLTMAAWQLLPQLQRWASQTSSTALPLAVCQEAV